MKYDKMPRNELIQELQAWEAKFKDRVDEASDNKRKELTKKHDEEMKKIKANQVKVFKRNNKTLEECLNELLDYELKDEYLLCNDLNFKNIYLYIKIKLIGIFENITMQNQEDQQKVIDAIKLILDRIKK